MAIDTTTSVDVQTLTPFKKFIMTIGVLPTSYLESMSYAELVMWFCNYLQNTVIPTVNNNAEAVQELQGLYEELKSYVDHYFDNIDLQDEVNNKLDAMVESGQLQQLLLNAYKKEIEVNHSLDLHLASLFNYTGATSGAHYQACCTNGNLLYQLQQGTAGDGSGNIYIFNYVNGTLQNTITNASNVYHGNDCVYLDGILWIDPLELVSGVPNKGLTRYNLDTQESTIYYFYDQLYPTMNHIIGVDKYDGKLLVWLSPEQGLNVNTIINDKFVLTDVSDMTNITTTELTLHDENNLSTFMDNITQQQLTVCGNKVYLLLQKPNIIIEGSISGTDLYLEKYYSLPGYDDYGIGLGETEAVAFVESTSFPKGTLILNARNVKYVPETTTEWGHDILQTYIFNPVTNVPRISYSAGSYPNQYLSSSNIINVQNSATNLIEDGTSAHPFHDLNMAIQFANNAKNYVIKPIILIKDSESYFVPYLYNSNVLIQAQAGAVPTIYLNLVVNSNVQFRTTANATSFKIKSTNTANNRITLQHSNISCYRCEFNQIQIQCTYGTQLWTRQCTFNNAESVTSTHAIELDSSFFLDGIGTWTLGGSDKRVASIGGNNLMVTTMDSSTYVASAGLHVV